uniref:Uncharacterized protein n=1 Tax=viral metagenome TaxID=1070528 RepID=A0A6M3KKJ8_9ZZZZ
MGAGEFDEKVRDEVSEWIDSDVIAEEILEDLEEEGVAQTLENAKVVWLDVLESELPDAIRRSINAKF